MTMVARHDDRCTAVFETSMTNDSMAVRTSWSPRRPCENFFLTTRAHVQLIALLLCKREFDMLFCKVRYATDDQLGMLSM